MKTQKVRKKELLCVILLLFSGTLLYGQKEGFNWIFGQQAGITFMPNGSSSDYSGWSLNQSEGCATLSDPSGNLLLFTDGDTVWDYNNSIVAYDLYGHQSSTQSAIILPMPDNPEVYYVFTIYEDFTFLGSDIYGLRYTIIRGHNNNSYFTSENYEKNILICNGVAEKLAAVKKRGQPGYWVVTHEQGTDKFLVFSFDQNGVSSPTSYRTWIPHDKPNGYLKFSPSGAKLACATYNMSVVEVYDFDAWNGIIGTRYATQAPTPNYPVYGVEFSPSESLLYFTYFNYPEIFQIDLNQVTNDTVLSYVVIDTSKLTVHDSCGALQLAPDGKIYVARIANRLGVINDPDNKSNPDFQDYDAPLMSNSSRYGLPNFSADFSDTTNTKDSICFVAKYDDVEKCKDRTITLNATNSLSYQWTPTQYIVPGTEKSSSPEVFNPISMTFTVKGNRVKDNLLTNASFENGFTGFYSDYDTSYTNIVSGEYYITDDPGKVNSSFSSCTAKSGTDMMVVNGSILSNKEVWFDTVYVTTNLGDSFYFSFWATSVQVDSPAILRVYVEEENQAKRLLDTIALPSGTCDWQHFKSMLYTMSTSSWLRISIEDVKYSEQGNDFALDSIWLSEVCGYIDSVFVDTTDCGCEISVSPNTIKCEESTISIHAWDALTCQWTPTQYIVPGTENTSSPQVFNPVPETFKVQGVTLTSNLLTNGNFENGFEGFYSDYDTSYSTVNGQYYITDDPYNQNGHFSHCTAKSGTKMMVADGATTSGEEVWFDTVYVAATLGDSFYFSFWATSVYTYSPATLRVYVEEENQAKRLLDTIVLSANTCNWQHFENILYTMSTSNWLRISIEDARTVYVGNDFALDSMWLSGLCSYKDSVFVDTRYCESCEASVSDNTIKCKKDTIRIHAWDAFTYQWTPTQYIVPGTENTSSPQVFNPVSETFKVQTVSLTSNLLDNGNFEDGFVGFYSDYDTSYTNIVSGEYYITDNPNKINGNFSNCTAKSGTDMMVVNGSILPNKEVWFDTVYFSTVLGDSFYFSFWATSVQVDSPAILRVYVEEENQAKRLLDTIALPSDTCDWQHFKSMLYTMSTSSWLRISIEDVKYSEQGNDFALDSMWLSGLCGYEDSVLVDVIDCDSCGISISNDTMKCVDEVISIYAWNALTYQWTPTQYIVSGTENTSSPQVFNPVPETFTVEGLKKMGNLIYNSSFENGFTGFYSDYDTSYSTSNGQYYITDDPNNQNGNFPHCTAKSGTKMMVADGDTLLDKEVWFDTIHVQAYPGDPFYFSFWTITLYPYYPSKLNPANLKVYIEEENSPKRLLGGYILPYFSSCIWEQFKDTIYASSTSNWFRISIVDSNTRAMGNDFALDDMWFSHLCNFRDSVFVDTMDCGCERDLFEKGVSHDTIDFLEEGQSIKYTSDCGFIGAVNTYEQTTGIPQMELLKLDDAGAVLWNKRYIINSESLSGNLLNVEQTTDVGYVSCGWIFNPDQPDNKDYFILKTDSNGIPEWSGFSNQPEADDEFMDIEQTFDGGYIAVGYTNIYPYPTPAVVKLDQNGNLDWGNTYYDDYNLDCVAHSIDLIDDNGDGIEEGYVITGYYGNVNTPTYKRDVWVMRIDLSGTIVWSKDVPMYDDQVGRSIKQYAPGYYAVTGFTELADSMGSTITNLFFMYFNEYSPAVAFYSIGTEGLEDGYAIEKYNDTSFIIAGETSDLYGQNKDALLLNVGLSGTVKWSHIFGDKDPAHPDWARSVEVLDDASQIAFIGTTTRFIDPSGDRDYYVVNTDNNGFAWCDDDSIDLTTVYIWTEFQILEYEFEEIEFEGITVVEYDPPYEEELCPDDDGDAQKRINEDVLFEQSLDGKLKVYPVPLGRDRQLKFDYTSVEDVKIKVRLYNLLGSMILEESFEANEGMNTYGLDLNGQSAGTYFLKVSCSGKDYSSKVLIMD